MTESQDLRIGGMVLSCNNGFVSGASRKVSQKRRGKGNKSRKQRMRDLEDSMFSSDSEDADIIADYIQSCRTEHGPDSDSSESEASLDLLASLVARSVDGGPRIEDLDDSETDEDESASSDSGSDDSYDSDLSSNSDVDPDQERTSPGASIVDLAAMYPVLLRTPKQPSGGSTGRQARQTGKKSGGGKGEPIMSKAAQKLENRQRQKRQRVESKRAERMAERGFNLGKISRQLHNLVANDADLDMLGFAPFGRGENKQILQMATLYGLNGSEQSAKGNKRFVTVTRTRKARLPDGKAQARIQAMVKAHRDRISPQQGAKLARDGSDRHSLGSQPSSSKKKAALQQQRSSKPFSSSKKTIGFLSTGCLNDKEPEGVVVFRPAGTVYPAPHLPSLPSEPTPQMDTISQNTSSGSLQNTAPRSQPNGGLASVTTREQDTQAGLGFARMGDLDGAFAAELGSSSQLIRDMSSGDMPAMESASELASPGLGEVPRDVAQVDVNAEMILGSEAFSTGFGCLSVYEDRQQQSPDESEGAKIHYESLACRPLPSILMTKKQHKKALKKMDKDQRRAARESMGMPPGMDMGHHTPAMEHGAFEAHTRGIGSRILAQMGYLGEGTGLGRNKQGISEPLKAHHRPKKLGLGA